MAQHLHLQKSHCKHQHVGVVGILAATDACTPVLTLGKDIATRDGELAASDSSTTLFTTANTGSICTAESIDLATRDGDIATVAIASATDAGTVITSVCSNGAAVNNYRAAITVLSTSDACALLFRLAACAPAERKKGGTVARSASADLRTYRPLRRKVVVCGLEGSGLRAER